MLTSRKLNEGDLYDVCKSVVNNNGVRSKHINNSYVAMNNLDYLECQQLLPMEYENSSKLYRKSLTKRFRLIMDNYEIKSIFLNDAKENSCSVRSNRSYQKYKKYIYSEACQNFLYDYITEMFMEMAHISYLQTIKIWNIITFVAQKFRWFSFSVILHHNLVYFDSCYCFHSYIYPSKIVNSEIPLLCSASCSYLNMFIYRNITEKNFNFKLRKYSSKIFLSVNVPRFTSRFEINYPNDYMLNIRKMTTYKTYSKSEIQFTLCNFYQNNSLIPESKMFLKKISEELTFKRNIPSFQYSQNNFSNDYDSDINTDDLNKRIVKNKSNNMDKDSFSAENKNIKQLKKRKLPKIADYIYDQFLETPTDSYEDPIPFQEMSNNPVVKQRKRSTFNSESTMNKTFSNLSYDMVTRNNPKERVSTEDTTTTTKIISFQGAMETIVINAQLIRNSSAVNDISEYNKLAEMLVEDAIQDALHLLDNEDEYITINGFVNEVLQCALLLLENTLLLEKMTKIDKFFFKKLISLSPVLSGPGYQPLKKVSVPNITLSKTESQTSNRSLLKRKNDQYQKKSVSTSDKIIQEPDRVSEEKLDGVKCQYSQTYESLLEIDKSLFLKEDRADEFIDYVTVEECSILFDDPSQIDRNDLVQVEIVQDSNVYLDRGEIGGGSRNFKLSADDDDKKMIQQKSNNFVTATYSAVRNITNHFLEALNFNGFYSNLKTMFTFAKINNAKHYFYEMQTNDCFYYKNDVRVPIKTYSASIRLTTNYLNGDLTDYRTIESLSTYFESNLTNYHTIESATNYSDSKLSDHKFYSYLKQTVVDLKKEIVSSSSLNLKLRRSKALIVNFFKCYNYFNSHTDCFSENNRNILRYIRGLEHKISNSAMFSSTESMDKQKSLWSINVDLGECIVVMNNKELTTKLTSLMLQDIGLVDFFKEMLLLNQPAHSTGSYLSNDNYGNKNYNNFTNRTNLEYTSQKKSNDLPSIFNRVCSRKDKLMIEVLQKLKNASWINYLTNSTDVKKQFIFPNRIKNYKYMCKEKNENNSEENNARRRRKKKQRDTDSTELKVRDTLFGIPSIYDAQIIVDRPTCFQRFIRCCFGKDD